MDSNQPLRDTVLRYLSNELTESEREAIDERLLTDADYEALFRENEYDLVDAYVAKELSDMDRSRVESGVRARVWHTQGLQAQAAKPSGEFAQFAQAERKAASTIPMAAVRARSLWKNRPALAIAAGALIAIVSLSLFLHSRGHAGAPEAVNTAKVTPPPAPQVSSNTHTTVLLLSGATRSQSALGVSLAADVTELRVQWLPTMQPVPLGRFNLDVVSETGVPECHAEGIPGKMHGQTQVIEFVCPAGNLTPGSAFFRVQPAKAESDSVPLLETSVSIQRAQRP